MSRGFFKILCQMIDINWKQPKTKKKKKKKKAKKSNLLLLRHDENRSSVENR